MVISLNSLDSNTSPHSRHSTNSESSSRDTMRTRGCLHSAVASLLGNWGRRDWLHKSGLNSCPSGSGQRRRKVGGILALVLRLSSLEISSRELRCATAQVLLMQGSGGAFDAEPKLGVCDVHVFG